MKRKSKNLFNKKVIKERVIKKIISALLMVVIAFTTTITAFAAENICQDDVMLDYNIIYYESEEDMETTGTLSNVIVLMEEQLLQLGCQVKELFDNASMIYVLTEMSISEIQEVCDMPSILRSDDVNGQKFATAITKGNDGNYVFNEVSAVFTDTSSKVRTVSNVSVEQKVYDGIYSVLKTTEKELSTTTGKARMQAANFDACATDSVVVYDSYDNRIGTMGYTTYWYKISKSGSSRIFDVITVATFAPDTGYKCKKMSVYLGTSESNHEVLEAANIISNGKTTTHSLGLSASKDGIGGEGSTSWSYSVDAQTVTKSFDMTTNDRTWTFKPKSAGDGDAWIEEPGIRMYSSQERCCTQVTISCPFVNFFGIELSSNILSTNWYMDWN